MQSYNIIYKNNKFYNQATGERIYPKDGAAMLLAGDNNAFGSHDPLNMPPQKGEILDNEAKKAQILNIKNLKKECLMLPAKTRLYFEFNITKLKGGQEETRYGFSIQLLEDLFLHNCTNWKAEKLPELCACHCIVDKDKFGNIQYFEPIYAQSVNEAITKTRQFYFPNQGTPGASVYVLVKEAVSQQTLEKIRASFFKIF